MILKGKRVEITGASSGIGLEILKLLLKKGCYVVACARHVEGIDIKSRRLLTCKCDVSKKEDIDHLFDFAIKKMGHIDLFISNAGFAYYEQLDGPDWDHIEKIVDTNYTGFIYCAEKMREHRGKKPYNFVVTGSSMGLLSMPGYALYSGTKAAVRGFADAYRYELGRRQHLQVIYPVATKTKFFDRAASATPVPWPTQTPEEVARRVILGIELNKKKIYPCFTFVVTMMVDRICPVVLRGYALVYNVVFHKWLRQQKKQERN